MKILTPCLVVGLMLKTFMQLMAQYANPYELSTYHKYGKAFIAENYLALAYNPRYKGIDYSKDGYYSALKNYLEQRKQDNKEPINLGIDQERERLLMALELFRLKKKENALDLLRDIDTSALYDYEQQQVYLLQAYLYLVSKQGSDYLDKAQNLLERCVNYDNLIGEQAKLYINRLVWLRGEPQKALNNLESEVWLNEFLPDVAYLGLILSYSLDSHTVALSNSQDYLKNYPHTSYRQSIQSLMSQAYYHLGDYKQTIKILTEIRRSQELSSAEQFYLGASYYACNEYDKSVPALQKASVDGSILGSLAHFALGNIYQKQEKHSLARLAFEAAYTRDDSSESLKEQALYRLIELNSEHKTDIFGSSLRFIQRFINDYPRSQYLNRILDILRLALQQSTDYTASLNLLSSLEKISHLELNDVRQELLFKQILMYPNRTSDAYISKLSEVINLGSISPFYRIALLYRAEAYLKTKQYKASELDLRLLLKSGDKLQDDNTQFTRYLLAYNLFNQKDYVGAEKLFAQLNNEDIDRKLLGDISLRLGDCYRSEKIYDKAIIAYNKTLQLQSERSDEAIYQLTQTYRQQGKHKEVIDLVTNILKEYPASSYAPELFFARGKSASLIGNNPVAIESFEKLSQDYPTHALTPQALLELALLYSNLDNTEDAIKVYKRVVAHYPQTHEAQVALADLKSVYLEQDRLKEYFAYRDSLGGEMKLMDLDKAQLEYSILEDQLQKNEASPERLEIYLKTYPQSPYASQVKLKLSKLYLERGDNDLALNHLEGLRVSPPSSLEEQVKVYNYLAKLYEQKDKYQDAYFYCSKAYNIAKESNLSVQQVAWELMLLALKLNKSDEGLSLSEELLKYKNWSEEKYAHIYLLKGRFEELSNRLNKAIISYQTTMKEAQSIYAAEATVRYAAILFASDKVGECQLTLEKFIASSSPYPYWVARAFILLSDTYRSQGDDYLAKQYLESLKENYTGQETDILEMISVRLRKYDR